MSPLNCGHCCLKRCFNCIHRKRHSVVVNLSCGQHSNMRCVFRNCSHTYSGIFAPCWKTTISFFTDRHRFVLAARCITDDNMATLNKLFIKIRYVQHDTTCDAVQVLSNYNGIFPRIENRCFTNSIHTKTFLLTTMSRQAHRFLYRPILRASCCPCVPLPMEHQVCQALHWHALDQ